MVLSCGKSIISDAQEFMRKITQKGEYTSIRDRFQNDEVFHASQRQHNWTDEWCKYLSYVRTFDITHRVLQNNENDTLRCIIFDTIQNIWREAL